MYDVFKDLNPEEAAVLRARINELGITEEDINSINLPYTIIENISDDELVRQVNMRKNLTAGDTEEPDEEGYVDEEPVQDTNQLLKESLTSNFNVPLVEEQEEPKSKLPDIPSDADIQPAKKKRAPRAKPKVEPGLKQIIKEVEEDEDDEDLFNLPIMNVSTMHAHDNYIKHVNMNVATYEVVLPQSGYSAKMRGLTADEIDVLRNSINTSYQSSREDLTKIVFNCIRETGLKQFTLSDFENYTSLLDFNILLFGILHQTYGALNSFDFTCPHCSNSFKRDIVTNSLIQVKSQDASDAVVNIQHAKDKNEAFKKSLLRNYRKRLRIPESDIIIEIGLANIVRDKTIGSYFSRLSDKEKNTRKFFLTSIITKLLLPQYDINGGVAGYAEVTSPSEIYSYLDDVKSKSYNKIIPKINKILDKYTIAFKIPDVTCPSCRKDIEGSNIDMADYFLLEVIRDGFVELNQES